MKTGSNLEKILESGKFAVTAELGPPKSADGDVIRKKAKILKDVADAVNITDNQTAIVRLSSIAAGAILVGEDLEPVVQMTTRDRNRIGIQSDLLGAAALGVKNLLCLTGDHQKFGNHPEAKGVFDLDSIQLVKMVKDMRNERRFLCGEEMEVEPRFFIGAVENPFSGSIEMRARRLGKKVAAGAEFVQTQITYDVKRFTDWMTEVGKLGLHKKVHVLAGVSPLKSAGMAKYMKNKVPGMMVPDEVVERMEKAENPKQEGIDICVDVIKKVKDVEGVAGVHVMAIEWEDAVPVIVEKAGLLPRPAPYGAGHRPKA